jgi:hypothetical protein
MLFLAFSPQQGPVSHWNNLGSCVTPDKKPVEIAAVELLKDRERTFDSSVGRVRVVLQQQRFALELVDSPDPHKVTGDVGNIIGEGDERADVFLTLGLLGGRPVLYWRETYQHRIFRPGLMNIFPEATRADWAQVLTPLCEGEGGSTVLD